MIEIKKIDQVIATRTLTLTNSSESNVEITIGMPQSLPENTGFYCPFQITGLHEEVLDWSGGIDTVQALVLALEKIGAILKESEEYKKGELFWKGSEVGHLGLPPIDSCGMLELTFSHKNRAS